MNYGYQRIVKMSVDEADLRIRETLKEQGFGVLTEIDVKTTFKAKLDVEFKEYRILGACNPSFAHKALTMEPAIGLLLPCNVVLWDNEDNSTTVSVIDAKKMLAVSGRDDLTELSEEVNGLLRLAVDAV